MSEQQEQTRPPSVDELKTLLIEIRDAASGCYSERWDAASKAGRDTSADPEGDAAKVVRHAADGALEILLPLFVYEPTWGARDEIKYLGHQYEAQEHAARGRSAGKSRGTR
jgi:hypothetical protein